MERVLELKDVANLLAIGTWNDNWKDARQPSHEPRLGRSILKRRVQRRQARLRPARAQIAA